MAKPKQAQAPPTKIAGYTVLPLTIPPLPSISHQTRHYLYLRPHEPKNVEPTRDTRCSLFAVNLPIDATESALRTVFKALGGVVERVDFEDLVPKSSRSAETRDAEGPDMQLVKGKKRKRGQEELEQELATQSKLPSVWDREVLKSGSCAVVVFVDKASRDTALKGAERAAIGKVQVEWRPEGGLGSQRYLSHHKLTHPPRADLQASINSYMTTFARLEARKSRSLAALRSVPDEDGFITVTRGGRTGPARLEEAQAAAEKLKERQKPPEDFYRFQMREKRKEREGELRKRFEKDRERVREMRERRGKIKPL